MNKILDFLPDISWTWNFGSGWDWLVVVGSVALLGYIVYLWRKANK